MTYDQALAWLYASQQSGMKLGLENTRRLLEAVGSPDSRLRCIHVAGTNGKGSTCAMIDSILRAAGYRVGLTTSPHLVDVRERIKTGGESISSDRFARLLTRLREATTDWEHGPTFFELTTVAALMEFAEQNVDYAVLETGLGGRLDSTNVVDPVVSVITPISFDHMRWLGNDLATIAGEKAGIIKPNRPVVSAIQEPAAAEVLQRVSEDRGSPLTVVTEPVPDDWPLGLIGRFQQWNGALAIAAVRTVLPDLSEEWIRSGLRDVWWPGRFQRDGCWLLDGAHNAQGAKQLVQTWKDQYGDARATIIFGALRDKEYKVMLETLALIASEWVFVPVVSSRGEDPAAFPPLVAAPSRVCESFEKAAEQVQARVNEREESAAPPVIVTGSLYLVGEAIGSLMPERM